MKRLLLIPILLVAFGCATTATTPTKATGTTEKPTAVKKGATAAPTQEKVVARLNGVAITEKELDDFLGGALDQVRQQEYKIKHDGLRDYIFEKIEAKEAKALGITTDEYYKKNVTDKVVKPSEEEINQVLNRYRSRLPKDDAQARQKVVDFLQGQKKQERENAFKDQLLTKNKVVFLLQPPRAKVAVSENDPVRGAKDAPVTIVEFSDFQCPYCTRVVPTIHKIEKEYEGKVKLIFKQLPLSFHQNAMPAAHAALCAKDQGKFWDFHDWMYSGNAKLDEVSFKKEAEDLKMDVDTFMTCLKEKKHADQIKADQDEAKKLGATATPYFFINGRTLRGAQPYEKFKEIIDEELALSAQSGN